MTVVTICYDDKTEERRTYVVRERPSGKGKERSD